MRSHRAAMFVLHVDTFQARAMLAPRSRAVKKPYGASFKEFALKIDPIFSNSLLSLSPSYEDFIFTIQLKIVEPNCF